MRALLLSVLLMAAPWPAQSVVAQERVEPPGQWQLGGARSTTPTEPGRVKETAGVLSSGVEDGRLRFQAEGRVLFDVPLERIIAMHFETSDYPRRFLRRPSYYLTVHYLDASGEPAVETIRLLSEQDALLAITRLEQETGRPFDRSPVTQSFLGIPIRARVGARVVVTDQSGQTIRGVITRLSSTELVVDGPRGAPRTFTEPSLNRVRLAYSPRHDLVVGLLFGAGVGAASGALLGAGAGSGCGIEGCHVLEGAALGAGVVGGLGALIGVTVGALRYPFNDAFDVYRSGAPAASTRLSVTVAPRMAPAQTGAMVLVRF